MGLWDKIKDGLTNSKGEIADAAREAAEKAQAQADAAREKADEAAQDASQAAPEAPQAAPAPAPAPTVEPVDEPKAAPHVDKPVKPAKPKKKFKEYTVVSGDTLSEIGARFGADWHEIARINKIENPDLIFPGQVFKIPVD